MAHVRLDREIVKHWIYKDAEYFKVWFEMLYRARYVKDSYTDMHEGEFITINYGEFIFGRVSWSDRLKISEQRLRTLLKKLQDANMIQIVNQYRKSTVYLIVNYEKFNQQINQQSDLETQGIQGNDNQQDNHQPTSSQPAANQQLTTNYTDNTDIQEKKKINKRTTRHKNGRDDPSKQNYAEFVWMKPEEYEKLIAEHGEDATKEMTEILNSYKAAKGEIYASDYHTMVGKGWVLKRFKEDQNKLTVITGGARNGKPRTSSERSGFDFNKLSL